MTRRVAESRRGHVAHADAVERLLHDLALAHGQAVPNRIEPGDPPAVPREEEVVGAAVHRGEGGERAPAGAQGTRRGESPRVAEAAADERKVGVQEPRADELAELTGCGDAAVRQDLDEADLGPQMQRPALALAGPRSEEHTSELQSRGHLVCRL